MNCRRFLYNKRIMVWGVTLIIGGLLIFYGYSRGGAYFTHTKAPIITGKMATKAGSQEQSLMRQAPKNQSGIENVQSVSAVTAAKESRPKEVLSIKDFPSPVQGKILRNEGNYYSDYLDSYIFHAGTDYAEPEGTKIRATHSGKVVSAGPDLFLGQKVTLDCGDGWQTTYGGLENLRVRQGDVVEDHDLLGQVGFFSGADGTNGQSQLHYEIWHENKVQSPGSGT